MLHRFQTPRSGAEGAQADKQALDEIVPALAAFFHSGTAAIALLDLRRQRFDRANARFCELLNYDAAALLRLRLSDVLLAEENAAIPAEFCATLRQTGSWEGEIRAVRSDGAPVWLKAGVTASRRGADGAPTHAIAVLQDIGESRATLERLRVSEEVLRLGQVIGRIATLSRDMRSGVMSFGATARAMFGIPHAGEEIPFSEYLKLLLPEDVARFTGEIEEALARRDVEFGSEFRLVRGNDRSLRYIELRVRFEYDDVGEPLRSVGVAIDVTERKQAEQRLQFAAQHDALTGLSNRVHFCERLEEACARARRGELIAVLCLDLDHFKEVNDTLGHPIGDQLLIAVGRRLHSLLRATDTLARLGGDEFAVVQLGLREPEDAARLARRLVDKLREPFLIGAQRICVGVSVGIAVGPRDGQNAEDLIKGADLALYEAKAQPQRGWRIFDPRMNEQARARYALENELRHALAHDEFELFYQPMLEASPLRVRRFEALIRWRHPKEGLLAPDRFIAAAEQNGMICEIGRWVLCRACLDASRWPDDIGVAVNVSAVQVADGDLAKSVESALQLSGLAAERLELEITETALMQDTEATLAKLAQVKALGVRIALDDFGAGHASLGYLRSFPFDKVKIDRSFTREIDRSANGAAVVKAMLDLCQAFNLATTVEGVETQAQLEALMRMGSPKLQGFLFSPPRPLPCVPELIEKFSGSAENRRAAE